MRVRGSKRDGPLLPVKSLAAFSSGELIECQMTSMRDANERLFFFSSSAAETKDIFSHLAHEKNTKLQPRMAEKAIFSF